jgi:hypothetical protein
MLQSTFANIHHFLNYAPSFHVLTPFVRLVSIMQASNLFSYFLWGYSFLFTPNSFRPCFQETNLGEKKSLVQAHPQAGVP